jgi:integrase
MATIYRKAWTAPLPPNAEISLVKGVRTARWRLRNGDLRIAEVLDGADGRPRIRGVTRAFVAKFRDHVGIWHEIPTKCTDEVAAREVLARLVRRSELVRSGVISQDEDVAATHGRTPIAEHIDAYVAHLRLKSCDEHRVKQVESRLGRVLRDCCFARLGDLALAPIEAWLSARKIEGMASGTRNGYREVLLGFSNWCVKSGRLVSHKLGNLPRGDVRSDRRRVRRALTEDELERLLEAARSRPLVEALTVRHGPRAGSLRANVRPHVRERLEAQGRERALLYKVLVLTGLRKAELASITIAQAVLDGATPHLVLDAADEKNRAGSLIPLRPDLAADLRAWLVDRLALARATAERLDRTIPTRLPPDAKLLDVPSGLIRILDRDLVHAGIARVEVRKGKKTIIKTDERGRTVDVHALRHTFGSHLAKAGVSLRTTQEAMRHSDPSLTANVYTDPKMLDIAGALERLPGLALRSPTRDGCPPPATQRRWA